MGSEYTRNDSANNIADGNVISAADLDGEFEKLVTAFTAGTGHSHDGTTAEGGYVTKLLGTAITIGDGTAGTDIVVTFDGETNDGTLTWMEDEARFDFANKVKIVDGTDVDVSDTTVGSLVLAGGAVITKDLLAGNDILLDSDNSIVKFGADQDITLTHAADTSLTLGGAGGTTGLIINNTATDGDPFLAFALSGTQTFTMGIDDGDSDAFKIGTSAIGTNTRLTIDSSGNTTLDGDLTVNGDTVTFASANSTDPVVIIKNTTSDTAAARLHFVKDKGTAGADGDDIGTIEFISDDDAQNQTSFAKIVAEVSESAHTDEAGKLSFFVAESDGTTTALTAGLILEGEHATDGEVDVTIGAGAASTTTIAGGLSLPTDSVVLSFGADSDTTLTHTDGTGLTLNSTNKLTFGDAATFINQSTDGQLDIDADTELELTAPTVDIAASTAVTIATPSLIITDNTTDEPIVQIKNTHNGTTAGELRFVMDKGAAGADGDDLGTISFYGDDAGQNQTAFAKIVGEVSEADETDEAGKLSFFVAESDGTNTALTAGLILEGEHATDGEVDVTIGAGTASTTTVAGNLVVTTSVEGGVVFNESGASVDFRIEGDTNQNLFVCDGSSDDIGIGIATPTFATGNGVHIADDYHLGFGNGNGTRPDFQFGYDATNTRLALKCGTGSDDTDIFFTTGGTLGLGASPSVNLHIVAASDEGTPSFAAATHFAVQATASSDDNVNASLISGTAGISRLFFGDKDDEDIGKIEYNNSDNDLAFFANTTERLKILSGGNVVPAAGYFKASNASDKFYNGTDPSSGNWHEFNSSIGNEQILAITNHNTGTDNEGIVVRHVANTNNTSSGFINCANDVNGNKFAVKGNGNVQSATNSYGSTSDERLKSDIKDANSQWNDIKALRFRNFKKYDTENLVHLGLIAQEAEKISPNIVSDSKPSSLDIKHDASFGTLYTKDDSETQNNVLYTEDDQEVKDGDKKVGDIKTFAKKIGDVKEVKEKVKDIKYSVLYMKAVKALQEAMTRIETLETKVKALEDA